MKIGLTVYLETTLSRGHGLKQIQYQWYHRKKTKARKNNRQKTMQANATENETNTYKQEQKIHISLIYKVDF